MTKDEIKKGLKCCETDWCVRCPYFECIGCEVGLKQDVLNLITEQENEIELLKMQLQDVVNHADTFLAKAQKFEAENVKLKAKIEDLKDEIIYLERKIAIRDNALKDRDKAIEMLEGKQDTIVKRAKIDVLNELKKYLHTEDFDTPDERWKPESEFCAIIDELIKEVQNGEDKG